MAQMPKLQSLVGEQGITLSNFIISMPLCCPSRASILRGQYGHNTQIMGNDLPYGGFLKFQQLGHEESTIATWLQDAGYRTMLAGKYLNAFPDEKDPMHIPPGWTEWYSPIAGEPFEEYDYTLNENGTQVRYGRNPEDYGTDVYAQKTIDFIQRTAASGQPFFAHVSIYAPHWPTTPAPRHANLFPDAIAPRSPNFNEEDVSDKPSYIRDLPSLTEEDISKIDMEWRLRLQAMQAVDEMVEAIIETLESSGQLENTYLFFASDNGFHFGSHRQVLGKTSPYDEEVRVPLIVRGPGIPNGSSLEHLAGNIDLAPTWADIAGITPPDFVDGRSLLSLLGPTPPATSSWRQCFLLEHAPYDLQSNSTISPVMRSLSRISLVEQQAPILHSRSESIVSLPVSTEALPYRALRSYQFLYVEYPTDEVELYDLEKDPYQLDNIAPIANPQLVETLAARLGDLYTCTGENCRSVENEPIMP